MFLRNKINFVTLKSRFGGTRSRLPRNGYIRQLGETSWGPPGRKLCYVKSHFGGTRSRFPRNGYIRQSGESCRVEARQGETSRGPPRLALAKNPVAHARAKHIDLRHHFVREAIQDKIIWVQYIPTTEMTADSLTKALRRKKHEKCTARMGMTT